MLAVTSSPVTPSPRVAAEHELAALIAERGGQAVDLGLGHDLDLVLLDARESSGARKKLRMVLEEGAHLVVVEGVVERQHRRRVAHLGEARGRRRADAARRAVGADELREARSIAALRRRSAS